MAPGHRSIACGLGKNQTVVAIKDGERLRCRIKGLLISLGDSSPHCLGERGEASEDQRGGPARHHR